MSRMIATTLVLASLGFALAGCGYGRGDRAVSGGLIGAAARRSAPSPAAAHLPVH